MLGSPESGLFWLLEVEKELGLDIFIVVDTVVSRSDGKGFTMTDGSVVM